jgi:hypothetical protein
LQFYAHFRMFGWKEIILWPVKCCNRSFDL